MQQQDIITLLTELSNSLATDSDSQEVASLQKNIAPILLTDLQKAATSTTVTLNADGYANINLAQLRNTASKGSQVVLPSSNTLLQQSPAILKTLRNNALATNIPPVASAITGIGVSNAIDLQNSSSVLKQWMLKIQFTEFISIFLSTDATTPVLLLPVTINFFSVFKPANSTSFNIAPGSVWILSKLLATGAPANTYTGLTVNGGTISFNQLIPLKNKSISMPAGAVCTILLDLKQPVDTTVSPDNVGVDAMNANVNLPLHFSFSFVTPAAKIISIADASWGLYGSANTFHYDPGQVPFYNPVLNSILIGFKVTDPTFIVSKCDSPFFTIKGKAPILDGYWELPVATIDITKPNTATGTGALAVVCGTPIPPASGPGLQVTWNGLNGGPVDLRLPFISASVGVIGVTDIFAGNLYGSQQYNLWNNDNTGYVSTLNVQYTNLFTVYYLSFQAGEELLSTNAQFIANVDRPVRVDGSPVAVQGKNALTYVFYTPATKLFYLIDENLLVENYTPPGGGPVTSVPQEAIALTNGLLTITPVAGIILYGRLASADTFQNARMILSFGLYYLIPALPDPYASTFSLQQFNRYNAAGLDVKIPKRLPLSGVTELLLGMVRWPIPANAKPPQKAKVSFAILPLPGNNMLATQANASSQMATQASASSQIIPANTNIQKVVASSLSARSTPLPVTSALAKPVPVANVNQGVVQNPVQVEMAVLNPDPQTIWNNTTGAFSPYQLAMLDVSTNADLMGVSFSTMNIQAQSVENKYTITPVNNAGEADFLQILGMDLATPGKFIRAFTVPEITWEPTINLTPPVVNKLGAEPPLGWLLFGNDGGPSQLFNNSPEAVAIAPIPVSNFIVDSYQKNELQKNPLITASIFTLPFGMRSMAVLFNDGNFPAGYVPANLQINPQGFDITPTAVPNAPQKIVTSGLQISATGQVDPSVKSSPSFMGFTIQLKNILDAAGVSANCSILGPSVDTIFNDQFKPPIVHSRGVPLERIDFSGYGASMFSNWQDPTASIAATSQAKFDVFVGRTSLEIIQVKSLIYPWGIRVVRTITMYRTGSAFIYRVDSGWRAETEGVYDFSYKDAAGTIVANPYNIHPGIVKGVFGVKNIIENDLPIFNVPWVRNAGDPYIDPETQKLSKVPAGGITEQVILQPVYFDADVQIDNVIQGATNGKVPSKQMVGYVQLSPRGEPISPQLFNALLATQAGSLGGPVDCTIDVGKSGQHIRAHSVDVSNSVDQTNSNPVFSGTARGTVILPKDGSWSIVQHSQATNAVSAISNNASVPVIRRGQLKPDGTSDYPSEQIRLANPLDLLKPPDNSTINFGLLQNTGTQKVLFQLPAYVEGVKNLLSKDNNFPLAKFADAYHLVSSTSIFPNPKDIPDMDMSKFSLNILQQGYKLLNNINPGEILKQALPSPFYFVNTKDVKLYIVYNISTPNLNYDLDSTAQSWLSSAKDITLNVDLGPFTKLVYITGNFDSSNGADTAFNTPVLEFGPDLKPVADILQILSDLSGGDYADIAKKALDIAMSNSGDNFEYKFHADKEIATIQFPPAELDGPTTPLRLTAGMKVGAYFNETISITSDPSSLIPSAGAYFEFDGGMQVMCVSVGVGTIYAIGQVVLRMSADVKTGPALYMKFGFGIELMVGLPVVGNVSVTFMVGIEMTLTTSEIKITAFLLFKGEADLLGGLVDITITIEASGTVDKRIGGVTNMTAQVTFAIDISIFLIINIDFSKSWSETKQLS